MSGREGGKNSVDVFFSSHQVSLPKAYLVPNRGQEERYNCNVFCWILWFPLAEVEENSDAAGCSEVVCEEPNSQFVCGRKPKGVCELPLCHSSSASYAQLCCPQQLCVTTKECKTFEQNVLPLLWHSPALYLTQGTFFLYSTGCHLPTLYSVNP